MRENRILTIRNNLALPFADIFAKVTNNGFVTKNYSEKCLLVDLWHINRKSILHCNYKDFSVIDPESYLMLKVIIQALTDYGNGRPCDQDIWRKDLPPGNRNVKCCPSNHICRNHAEDFLKNLSPSYEAFAGLTPGTVKAYMKKFDKEIKNEIPTYFQYNSNIGNTSFGHSRSIR